jgi:hypothetical protein
MDGIVDLDGDGCNTRLMYVPNTIKAIEQIPSWDTNSRSAGQNKVLEKPTTGPYPHLDKLIHNLKPYFSKIHFNIILPFKRTYRARRIKGKDFYLAFETCPVRIPDQIPTIMKEVVFPQYPQTNDNTNWRQTKTASFQILLSSLFTSCYTLRD